LPSSRAKRSRRPGGSLVELRGDEALAVFDSARQALRGAADLQERFVGETVADPSLPLAVGIGLDAGEAVRVDGGYRGGALNLAARLCSLAGPGEVLVSPSVAHLARKVDGLDYVERGAVRLKGLEKPVDVVAVRPEREDAARELAFRRALRSRVASISFSLDGKTFATSGGSSGGTRIWATATLQQLGADFPRGEGQWGNVAYTPDGRYLLAVFGDGTAYRWPVSLKAWENQACTVAGRNFTREEWSRFVGGRSYSRVCPEFSAGG